ANEPGIGATRAQLDQQPSKIELPRTDGELWIGSAHLREEPLSRRHHGGQERELEPEGAALLPSPRGGFGALGRGEHRACLLEKGSSRLGRLHAAAVALEQSDAQVALQLADTL